MPCGFKHPASAPHASDGRATESGKSTPPVGGTEKDCSEGIENPFLGFQYPFSAPGCGVRLPCSPEGPCTGPRAKGNRFTARETENKNTGAKVSGMQAISLYPGSFLSVTTESRTV